MADKTKSLFITRLSHSLSVDMRFPGSLGCSHEFFSGGLFSPERGIGAFAGLAWPGLLLAFPLVTPPTTAQHNGVVET